MRPLIQPDWAAVAAGASGTQALAWSSRNEIIRLRQLEAITRLRQLEGEGGLAAGGGGSAAGGGEAAAGDGKGRRERPFTLWPNVGGEAAAAMAAAAAGGGAHGHSWWSADGSLGGATQEDIDVIIRRAEAAPARAEPAGPPRPPAPQPPAWPPPPDLCAPPPPPPPAPLPVPREMGDSPWGGQLRWCTRADGSGCGFYLYGKGQCLNPFCEFHRKRKSQR